MSLSLVLACGCSRGNPNAPAASVHGKVTYNDKPVTGGSLTLHPKDAGKYSVRIDKDGSYAGTDVPIGQMVVTVETASVKKSDAKAKRYVQPGGKTDPQQEYMQKMKDMGKISDAGPDPKSAGVYMQIPDSYADPEKSPLRITLSKGDQKHDLKLTD
jgi:hypothetical protein